MKEAGIKVWVLTGDKKETAINIGYSCNLLNMEIEKISIDGENFAEIVQSIDDNVELVIILSYEIRKNNNNP